MAGAGRRLHRARPDDHPARRRHRLHRRRDPADLEERGHQHREARGDDRGREVALPGVREPVPTIWTEAGVVTQRVAEAAERAGFVFAVDPTSAEASCIGGNVAMNAGGKKAVLWGTALDNLASLADGDARGQVARGDAPRPQPRQDPRRRGRELRAEATSTPTARSSSAPSGSTSPARVFRKEGLGKDVTDKFLAGLPGIQKEGCDGLITSGALDRAPHAGARAHRLPRVLRQRQGRGALHRRDQGLHVRRAEALAACSSPAWSTSTTAT